MHGKRTAQAGRASWYKVGSSGTFNQAYSSVPITGAETFDWKQEGIQNAKMLWKLKLLKTQMTVSRLHPTPSCT